jgi:hypothetical protein
LKGLPVGRLVKKDEFLASYYYSYFGIETAIYAKPSAGLGRLVWY